MENSEDSMQREKKQASSKDHFYSLIESLSRSSSKSPTSEQEVILKFMEKTISKVNYCLASLYATQQLLIQKGIVTRTELIACLKEAKGLPALTMGRDVLASILEDNEIDSILTMIDLPDDGFTEKDGKNS